MSASPALQYVILHHTGVAEPHFDLMVETAPDAQLSTWRLPHWPPRIGDVFTPLGPHRREYLEYEGPVSQNRGEVKRVARGSVRSVQIAGLQVIVTLGDGVVISLPQN